MDLEALARAEHFARIPAIRRGSIPRHPRWIPWWQRARHLPEGRRS
jgi:hypothetical protein